MDLAGNVHQMPSKPLKASQRLHTRLIRSFGCCHVLFKFFLLVARSGERLRFATCGFVRILVLRRSLNSGLFYRVAESPVRDAAAAAETQLYRWPSREEVLAELRRLQERNPGCRASKPKEPMDPGIRRCAYDLPGFAPTSHGNFGKGISKMETNLYTFGLPA